MDAKNANATGKKSKLERIEERITKLEKQKKLFMPERMRKREKHAQGG